MEEHNDTGGTKPFSFAEEIFSYSDRLSKTLLYFVGLSFFLVILVLWFVGGQPPLTEFPFYSLYLYGAVIVVYFPVALWNGVWLLRSLNRWKEDYFDFAFVVKFELFPARGSTPTERILNKLGEVYPEVAKLARKGSRAVRRESGITKRSKIVWDLLIDLKHPHVIRIPWIHRHLGEPEYLLVKRFGGELIVGASDLRALGEDIRRDLRWQNGSILGIFVVSKCGFAEDAIAAAREESIKELSRHPVELVIETAEGYELPIKD